MRSYAHQRAVRARHDGSTGRLAHSHAQHVAQRVVLPRKLERVRVLDFLVHRCRNAACARGAGSVGARRAGREHGRLSVGGGRWHTSSVVCVVGYSRRHALRDAERVHAVRRVHLSGDQAATRSAAGWRRRGSRSRRAGLLGSDAGTMSAVAAGCERAALTQSAPVLTEANKHLVLSARVTRWWPIVPSAESSGGWPKILRCTAAVGVRPRTHDQRWRRAHAFLACSKCATVCIHCRYWASALD